MKALLLAGVVSGALFASATCLAADATVELVRRPVIVASKLDEMRGGLSVAGLDFSVGAVMRTLVDGSLVLESYIDLGQLTGTGPTGLPSGASGFDLVGGMPSSANMESNRELQSFVLRDAKGFTQVIHDLTRDRIVATVVNQANQRQIQLELDINVTLHNFQALQAAAVRNRVLTSMSGLVDH